ncbi:MAG: hypothetical protein ACR2KK_20190 [Acidimicrobiales bacterium]
MAEHGGGRLVRQAGVVVAGLALGVGGIALFDSDDKPSYRPGTPSVAAFSFPTTVPDTPAPLPESIPDLAVEPANARAALSAFLEPLADGQPAQAYPLLDEASRRRFPTMASWIRAQADRATPVTFEPGAQRPDPERPGAFQVDLTATHRPSLDAVRGLVPERSASVWLVRREGASWRVSAEPLSFRPVLPADAAATDVVQDWVSRLAACDGAGAAELQVAAHLYGPASLVRAPCEARGSWTAGEPVGLDTTPDPRAFLAAFGPEVGTWARLVPVVGPGSTFLAAVAPMGDGWQVMGVAVGAL